MADTLKNGKSSIERRWHQGQELRKNWEGGVYGKKTALSLAKQMGVSIPTLQALKRLAERWTLEQVRAADKAGVSWHGVMLLMGYSPRPYCSEHSFWPPPEWCSRPCSSGVSSILARNSASPPSGWVPWPLS